MIDVAPVDTTKRHAALTTTSVDGGDVSERITITVRLSENDVIDRSILRRYDRAPTQFESADRLRRMMIVGAVFLYLGIESALDEIRQHPLPTENRVNSSAAPSGSGKVRRITTTITFSPANPKELMVIRHYRNALTHHEKAELVRRMLVSGCTLLYGGAAPQC